MEFKVGDRVKYVGKDDRYLGLVGEIKYIWKNSKIVGVDVGEELPYDFFIGNLDFYTEKSIKTPEQTKIEELEERIEKLEKCVMGDQNSLEKRENEPIYERNERFAKILKKELEEKPNLEINLGKPNIDDKEFKEMLKIKPIVSNTNDPLEMIWNSTEEETKQSLLTEDERVILRNLDKKWNWIVREKYGRDLWLHEEKPIKNNEENNWVLRGCAYRLSIYNNLFQLINWYDKEPYNIEELLKEEN